MKCVICHSPDIEKKEVTEEFKVGKDIILAPFDVLVCSNCGERYYNKATMQKFEEIERKLEAHKIPLREEGKVLVFA